MAKYTAYRAGANALTTELNALANGARAVSAALLDNSVNLDFWADFVLAVTFAVAPTANTTCDLYLLPAADGTNAADGSGAVAPQPVLLAGSFELRAVTTAQRLTLRGVALPPGKFNALLVNNSGQAFPATGSTVVMYGYQTQ